MVDKLAFGLMGVTLIVAAVIDWRTGRIPNWLTYWAMLLGVLFWATFDREGVWAGLRGATLALAAGLVPMALIFFAGGLGGGDVKLMGAIGAMCADWRCVLDTAVYAFIIGACMAVIVIIKHRIVGRTLRRLLSAAMMVAARTKPNLPDDSPRIAFGVALCVGGIVAGANHLLGVKLPW